MSKEKKHSMQPVITDNGVRRFKRNEIVDFIVMNGSINLNDIAAMNFSDEDQQQLAQLIGYSVSGYCDLSYVDDDAYNAAIDEERNSDALAASQPPEQPQTGWLPIETAPQIGPILLWWRTCKTPSVGEWYEGEMGEGWRCEGDRCLPSNQKDCTHWMPLPAAPQPKEGV